MPDIDGCDPRSTNLLQLEQLQKLIETRSTQIPKSEKLAESPDCVKEVPFEKLASPETLAALEADVIATIRIYLTDFIINSFPINSTIAINSHNYDEFVVEFIMHKMEKGIRDMDAFWASTYEGNVYWLLFLEQAAQIVKRKVDAGDIEMTPDIEEAFAAINTAQEEHTHINWWDLWSGDSKVDMDTFFASLSEDSTFDDIIASKGTDITVSEVLMLGSLFTAFGANAIVFVWPFLLVGGAAFAIGSLFSLERARFACLVAKDRIYT